MTDMGHPTLHTPPTAKDVTAVVCTWNAENNIFPCLQALKATGVAKIILVDATSSDNTRKLAVPFVDLILTDPRKGLAAARNVGVQQVETPYVIHVGPDNVMAADGVNAMLKYMAAGGYCGVSAMTIVCGPGYWSWATNLYKRARFYPGERAVIGTPSLLPVDLSLQIPYDENMGFSDDSDLCSRWGKQGYRFAVSDVENQEVGVASFAAIVERYRMYAKSDLQIWRKYAPTWTLGRKFVSIALPLSSELLQPLLRIASWKRFAALPFLVTIKSIRYTYWLKFSICDP